MCLLRYYHCYAVLVCAAVAAVAAAGMAAGTLSFCDDAVVAVAVAVAVADLHLDSLSENEVVL